MRGTDEVNEEALGLGKKLLHSDRLMGEEANR